MAGKTGGGERQGRGCLSFSLDEPEACNRGCTEGAQVKPQRCEQTLGFLAQEFAAHLVARRLRALKHDHAAAIAGESIANAAPARPPPTATIGWASLPKAAASVPLMDASPKFQEFRGTSRWCRHAQFDPSVRERG